MRRFESSRPSQSGLCGTLPRLCKAPYPRGLVCLLAVSAALSTQYSRVSGGILPRVSGGQFPISAWERCRPGSTMAETGSNRQRVAGERAPCGVTRFSSLRDDYLGRFSCSASFDVNGCRSVDPVGSREFPDIAGLPFQPNDAPEKPFPGLVGRIAQAINSGGLKIDEARQIMLDSCSTAFGLWVAANIRHPGSRPNDDCHLGEMVIMVCRDP